MSWVRLDDQFADHPKIVAAGPLAGWLFVCGLTYCSRYLTDGFIPAAQVRRLADLEGAAALAERLVEAGLWMAVDGGYCVHDYLRCALVHETPEVIRSQWEGMRARIAPHIYERDGHCCRYCGATEDLTIDHILPVTRGGSNNLGNLLAACFACNRAKGNRTPEEWQR